MLSGIEQCLTSRHIGPAALDRWWKVRGPHWWSEQHFPAVRMGELRAGGMVCGTAAGLPLHPKTID